MSAVATVACLPPRPVLPGPWWSLVASAALSEASEAAESGSGAAPVVFEVEMARRAGGGDDRAKAWLARRLLKRVRAITRALLGDPTEADDAAQLSLIAILRSAGTYRGDASLESWARRIAVRTTLRYIRRERQRRPQVSLDQTDAPPSGEESPHRVAALSRDVRVYLSALSEPQRTALVLHHALGHSIDEIATLTGVSPNTVKSRLRLGTKALRKRVRREHAIGDASAGRSPR